tara:strand:+ start:1069 stop:1398 length:330 start_codon:yes stop_codon:yes gene_type:complete
MESISYNNELDKYFDEIKSNSTILINNLDDLKIILKKTDKYKYKGYKIDNIISSIQENIKKNESYLLEILNESKLLKDSIKLNVQKIKNENEMILHEREKKKKINCCCF